MTFWIGICIIAVTVWLSIRYRPAEKDSFVLMGLCLFSGLIVLLSGVDSVNVMNVMTTIFGAVLLLLYRSQLCARGNSEENTEEDIPQPDYRRRVRRYEIARPMVRHNDQDYVA